MMKFGQGDLNSSAFFRISEAFIVSDLSVMVLDDVSAARDSCLTTSNIIRKTEIIIRNKYLNMG